MLWLWILSAVVLLIALMLWTRTGVWLAFEGKDLRLDVRFGLLRMRVLPAKLRRARAERPPKEKKPKSTGKPKEPEGGSAKPRLSFTLEDGKDALRTLLPPLGRVLKRLGRGIRVKPLRLSLALGGQEDPAASAQLYGELQAAVWTGMPLLEKLLDIRDPYIHTDVDFNAPGIMTEGEVGITLRIGTLLAAGFGMAFPALKWFLRWRKRCRTRLPSPEEIPPGSVPAAAR